jgi:hypothetical protein
MEDSFAAGCAGRGRPQQEESRTFSLPPAVGPWRRGQVRQDGLMHR